MRHLRSSARLSAVVRAGLLLFIQALLCRDALCLEFGFLNDLHFSARQELEDETEFQLDDYYALDAYRLFGRAEFHSEFHVTNDLALLDSEAAQLNLAYLSVDRLLGPLSASAGRQLFAQGFDAYIGDGLLARCALADALQLQAHFAIPFDAESEAIDNEPLRVYGLSLTSGKRKPGRVAPFRFSGQVERRDYTRSNRFDETLIGMEASTLLGWLIESDLYTDLEYAAEAAKMRRAKLGTELYLSPVLACRLEGERFEPSGKLKREEFREFLQDAITKAFSSSEIWSGRAALTYTLPRKRELSLSYSLQRYTRRGGERVFGHLVDGFLTFFAVRPLDASVGLGYSARIADGDSIHLGIARANAFLVPRRLEAGLTVEAGVLDSRRWSNELVLHARGMLRYLIRPNLEISAGLEENRNPYFDSDLRAIGFIRYFWGTRE
ncbi:MAG: hypothetical protein AB1640_11435 [bacterium]